MGPINSVLAKKPMKYPQISLLLLLATSLIHSVEIPANHQFNLRDLYWIKSGARGKSAWTQGDQGGNTPADAGTIYEKIIKWSKIEYKITNYTRISDKSFVIEFDSRKLALKNYRGQNWQGEYTDAKGQVSWFRLNAPSWPVDIGFDFEPK
jgi:hypothetical protein